MSDSSGLEKITELSNQGHKLINASETKEFLEESKEEAKELGMEKPKNTEFHSAEVQSQKLVNEEASVENLDEIIFNRILDTTQKRELLENDCHQVNEKDSLLKGFQKLTVDDVHASNENANNETVKTIDDHVWVQPLENDDVKNDATADSNGQISCEDDSNKLVTPETPQVENAHPSLSLPTIPDEVKALIKVVNKSIDEIILKKEEMKLVGAVNDDDAIETVTNLRTKYAFLLNTIFGQFCTPSPTYQQILAIVTQIDSAGNDHYESIHNINHDMCDLPQDVVVSSEETTTLVIQLLTRNVSTRLLALPETFQQSFFHILIRLLMNETYEEYLEYFFEESYSNINSRTDDAQSGKSFDPDMVIKEMDSNRSIQPSSKPIFDSQTSDRSLSASIKATNLSKNRNFLDTFKNQISSTNLNEAILKNNYMYSVVRFRCGVEWKRYMLTLEKDVIGTVFFNELAQGAMVGTLHLLRTIMSISPTSKIIAPVVRFLGISGAAGMSPHVLRQMLDLTSKPNSQDHDADLLYSHKISKDEVTSILEYNVSTCTRLSLIRALSFAVKSGSQSTRLVGKAFPRSFFDFTNGQGLWADLESWPLKNEYGFATWFRFESIPDSCTIVSLLNVDGSGLEVSLKPLNGGSSTLINESTFNVAAELVISIYGGRDKDENKKLIQQVCLQGCVLCPRVWYHLGVRHTEPRYRRYFSKAIEEVTVFVDGRIMLTHELKFPKVKSESNVPNKAISSPPLNSSATIRFAKNFNGQTGSLYFFKETISDATLQALYEVTSGLSNDETIEMQQEKNEKRSLFSKTLPDKGFDDDPNDSSPHALSKSSFSMKLLLVWDPSRTMHSIVVEGYNKINAFINPSETQPWYIVGAKEIISSIGGVQSLLSLFESFLAPNFNVVDYKKGSVSQSPLLKVKKEIKFKTHRYESEYWILPYLIGLLASFIRNDSNNTEDLLRCGGIEVLEQYFFLNKSMSLGIEHDIVPIKENELLMQRTSESCVAASKLVQSLEDLRQAASLNEDLYRQIFSKLIFNVPLWLGGTVKTFGKALFTVFLPYLSALSLDLPNEVQECIDVRDLFVLVNELIEVRGGTDLSPETTLFGRDTDEENEVQLSVNLAERRHAIDVVLGIFVAVISSKATNIELSPFLHFIAYNLDNEWEKASADGKKESTLKRKGSRRERYFATCKACSILLFLLQKRPPIPGLHASFEKCLYNANGIASFVLCGMVNSFDDFIRSLGIRCLTKFLESINKPNRTNLELKNSKNEKKHNDIHTQESDKSKVLVSKQGQSKLSQTMKYVGTGLRNMRSGTINPVSLLGSKVSENIVHKLLWHLLKCHRDGLDDLSHAALVDLLVDDGQDFVKLSKFSFSLADVVTSDPILLGGFRFNDEWAKLPTTPVGIDSSQNMRNIFAVGTILRLLRFLPNRMKERWLFDLLALIRVSPNSVLSILPSKDWQPCLFHLLSESVEEINKHHRTSMKETNEIVNSPPEGEQNEIMPDTQERSNQKDEESIQTSTDSNDNSRSEEIDFKNSRPEINHSTASKQKEQNNTNLVPDFVTSRSHGLQVTREPSVQHIDSLRARFDLVLKFYSTLLAHSIRKGGNEVRFTRKN